MEILVCPNCQMRVAIGDDYTCPSCRALLNALGENLSRATLDDQSIDGSAHVNEMPRVALTDAVPHKNVIAPSQTGFDIFSVCLSLKGRIPRSVYWFATIGTVVLFYFGATVTVSVLGRDSSTAPFLLLLMLALFLWSQLAISVKRFHDLEMSGLWVLLLLFPGIGQFVQFVILGLERGARSENRLGPDPLKMFT